MALFDFLIWLTLGGIVGASVGVGTAKLALYYKKRQDEKKVFEIIEGKAKNTFKLEGKMINVNKFTYKEDDGEIKRKVTLADIVKKTPQKPLKDEKAPIERTLPHKKVFFWKRKGKKQ